MHEKVAQFLNEQKELEKKEVLLELGLYEIEYSPTRTRSSEYPYYDLDSERKARYYKITYFDISDEEFEKIKKYYKPEPKFGISKNPICKILTAIAIITYIAAFIAGCCFAEEILISLIFWISGFISGSMFLGFAEIIKLLDNIKNKN